MAKVYNINGVPATGSVAMYQFKEVLKAAGWTVVSSSDGTTYNAAGDQITSGAAGANGMANNSAWFRIRSPGSSPRELTIQRGTTNRVWRIKYSRLDQFTGGTPGATQTPSATDQVVVRGGGTDAAPTFYTLHTTDGTYRWDVVAETERLDGRLGSAYGFWARSTLTAGDAARTALCLEPLDPSSYVEANSLTAPTVGDADPCVLIVGLGTANSLAWSMADTATSWASATITSTPVFGWYRYNYVGETFVNFIGARYASNFTSGFTLSTRSDVSPYDGKDEMLPILFGRPNDQVASQVGIKGYGGEIRQKGRDRFHPDTVNKNGPRAWAYVGLAANTNHPMFPWPLGQTPVGTAASVDYAGRDYLAVVPDTYTNRVRDSVAAAFVYWTTFRPDPTGISYPGPGTFGVNTSDYTVFANLARAAA